METENAKLKCRGILMESEKELYKEFVTYREANEYGYSHYQEWAEKYKENVRLTGVDVVSEYAGFAHTQYNDTLRNANKNDYINGRCELLKYVIASAPILDQNLIVYRSCCDKEISDILAGDINGTPVMDRGFLSTSLLFSEMKEQTYANVLKLYVPCKTHAIYITPIAGRTECEMLIYPENYKLLSAAPYSKEGFTVYECLLITKK